MHTIGTFWFLAFTVSQMVFLLGFLDPSQGSTETEKRSDCFCPGHLEANTHLQNKNYYRYCRSINASLECLKNRSKNCSVSDNVELATSILFWGSRWEYRHYNCTAVIKQGESKYNSSSSVDLKPNNGPKTSTRCIYNTKSVDSLHCGLFGDPHLKTFRDKRQTCTVKGTWSMIENKYLAVQVTNVVINKNNPKATGTSKISVVIKNSKDGCAEQKIYLAQSANVPAYFRDSTRETGPESCKTRIYREYDGVRLYICHLNTTILIRKVGEYLTFNIRTPENVVGPSTTGLCVNGCPPDEMIDYKGFFRANPNSVLFGSAVPAMSKNDAVFSCKIANLTDFYYDSCVFDLISTGDKRFLRAAYRAMQDAMQMDPKLRLRRSNSIVLQYMENQEQEQEQTIKTGLTTPNSASTNARTLLPYLIPLWVWFLACS